MCVHVHVVVHVCMHASWYTSSVSDVTSLSLVAHDLTSLSPELVYYPSQLLVEMLCSSTSSSDAVVCM